MIETFLIAICWFKGHIWPIDPKIVGRIQYINCSRCGEPDACTVQKDGKVKWSWR